MLKKLFQKKESNYEGKESIQTKNIVVQSSMRTVASKKPSHRTGHSLTYTSNDKLILLGGKDIKEVGYIVKYDYKGCQWTRQRTKDFNFAIRNHTAVLYNEFVVVYGGRVNGKQSRQMYLLNLSTMEWIKPTVLGSPPARAHHTAVLYENKMIIFGGLDTNSRSLSDTHVFDFTTYNWSTLNSQGSSIPTSRHQHTANFYNEKMFLFFKVLNVFRLVFGGTESLSKNFYNELYELTLANEQYKWSLTQTRGDLPCGRSLHCSVIKDDMMIIFGGKNNEDTSFLNDMYSLDLNLLTWTRIDIVGDIPSGVYGCRWVKRGDSLTLFGGKTKNGYQNDLYDFNFDQPDISQLIDLQESGLFSDVAFIIGDIELKAHKCIVSQSSVLTKLMESKKVVDLPGVSYQNFKYVIYFLYTSKLAPVKDVEHIIEMIHISDAFDLQNLSNIYLNELKIILTTENVVSISNLCEKLNVEVGVNLTLNFIFTNFEKKKFKSLKLSETVESKLLKMKSNFNVPQIPVNSTSMNSLYDHIYSTFNLKLFTDVTLIASDDVKLYSHRIILFTSSDYFRALFSNEFLDSNQDEIKLEIDSETLKLVLQFMYSENVHLPTDYQTLMNLIGLSDMMVLRKLRDLASNKLATLVTDENALEIGQFCQEYNLKGLPFEICDQKIKKSISINLLKVEKETYLSNIDVEMMKETINEQQDEIKNLITFLEDLKMENDSLKQKMEIQQNELEEMKRVQKEILEKLSKN
jgi:hypothetical protein